MWRPRSGSSPTPPAFWRNRLCGLIVRRAIFQEPSQVRNPVDCVFSAASQLFTNAQTEVVAFRPSTICCCTVGVSQHSASQKSLAGCSWTVSRTERSSSFKLAFSASKLTKQWTTDGETVLQQISSTFSRTAFRSSCACAATCSVLSILRLTRFANRKKQTIR